MHSACAIAFPRLRTNTHALTSTHTCTLSAAKIIACKQCHPQLQSVRKPTDNNNHTQIHWISVAPAPAHAHDCVLPCRCACCCGAQQTPAALRDECKFREHGLHHRHQHLPLVPVHSSTEYHQLLRQASAHTHIIHNTIANTNAPAAHTASQAQQQSHQWAMVFADPPAEL